MAVRGKSFAGGFAVAEETTYGVPNTTPDAYIPITSEGINSNRPAIERMGIYGSREVQCSQAGLETNSGPFSLEADAIALGLLLKWTFGAVSSSAYPGTVAAAPTTVGGTTGTLANGTYQYAVANVFERSWGVDAHVGAGSPASSNVVVSTGNGSAAVSWTNATPPPGYTLKGTAVYRKLDSGDLQKVHYLTGAGTSWTDTGATTPEDVQPPEQTFIHEYVPPVLSSSSDLPSFTIMKLMDLAQSMLFAGAKIGQCTMTVAEDGNSPVEFSFEVMAKQSLKVANGSPSHTPICSMLSWQSRVEIDGVPTTVAKAMTLTLNNNINSKRSLNGNPFPTDIYEGGIQTSGNLTLGFENFEQWDRLKAGQHFALSNRVEGSASTERAAFRIDANTVAKPFPFSCEWHLPKCLYDGSAGGNLNGSELMNESLGYKASVSISAGYSVRCRLLNRTPSY